MSTSRNYSADKIQIPNNERNFFANITVFDFPDIFNKMFTGKKEGISVCRIFPIFIPVPFHFEARSILDYHRE